MTYNPSETYIIIAVLFSGATPSYSALPEGQRLDDSHWLLSEAGLILNASTCSITAEELRTFPQLHGSMQTTLDTPYCYIQDKVSTVADHEIPLLEQITPSEVQQFDEVSSRVITSSQTFDVD